MWKEVLYILLAKSFARDCESFSEECKSIEKKKIIAKTFFFFLPHLIDPTYLDLSGYPYKTKIMLSGELQRFCQVNKQ